MEALKILQKLTESNIDKPTITEGYKNKLTFIPSKKVFTYSIGFLNRNFLYSCKIERSFLKNVKTDSVRFKGKI